MSGEPVTLSSARLRPALLAVMALVVAAGVAAEVLGAALGLRTDEGVVPLLSLSYEWNLPTAYSAALLLACALLAALAGAGAARGEGTSWHWRALALGFVLMGLDELLQVHESLAGWSGLGHVIHYDWVVPAAGLLVVLGAAFVPFLRRLPGPLRRRLLVAGAVYVGGAVAMELPLGWWASRHGSHGLGYGLLDALEESLEMLGLNLFLVAMVDHLGESGVTLRFAAPPPPEGP